MIDVIIPAYNSHHTIKNTLRSLAIQRLAKDLCVHIIDDGSERGYEEIIPLFKDDFKHIRQIRLDTNHGVGYCRQLALTKTRNPHIYFIDSDDVMVNPYTFNYFMREAINNPDYAVIYGNVIQETQSNTHISEKAYSFENDINIFTELKGNRLFLHGKMYSRKFITENRLGFIDLRSNEDIGFNIQVFTIATDNQVIRLPIIAATTLYNEKSITRSSNSTRKWTLSNVNEAYDGYEAILHAFNIVKSSSRHLEVNSKNYNLFIQRFLSLYIRYCHGEFEGDEKKELFRLICARYYRDIVIPIIKGTRYSYIFPTKWETNDFCHYINPTNDCPHPEINSWCKQTLDLYNEDRYNQLFSKYIAKEGYICQQTKILEEP